MQIYSKKNRCRTSQVCPKVRIEGVWRQEKGLGDFGGFLENFKNLSRGLPFAEQGGYV